MPVLLTAVKELNEPRYMAVDKIFDAYKKEVKILSFNDINIDSSQVGLKASPTKVFKSFTPEPKGKGVMFEGTSKKKVEQLVVALKQKHII
jgi:electron transfer flavoprotein beta subunit